jgi:vacuolar-type H+-ATPase subunit H
MESDILREIIDVEKDIQQSVDHTRVTIREWLNARKKEIEEELARSEVDMQESFCISRKTVIEDAQKKSVNIMADAERQAARLMQIKNDNLKTIVSNCLHRILPG